MFLCGGRDAVHCNHRGGSSTFTIFLLAGSVVYRQAERLTRLMPALNVVCFFHDTQVQSRGALYPSDCPSLLIKLNAAVLT